MAAIYSLYIINKSGGLIFYKVNVYVFLYIIFSLFPEKVSFFFFFFFGFIYTNIYLIENWKCGDDRKLNGVVYAMFGGWENVGKTKQAKWNLGTEKDLAFSLVGVCNSKSNRWVCCTFFSRFTMEKISVLVIWILEMFNFLFLKKKNRNFGSWVWWMSGYLFPFPDKFRFSNRITLVKSYTSCRLILFIYVKA